MCKVSVLIPAYNVELYIRECLDSVLNQTLNDFEIICVDDASTDETLNILREYEMKDSRIKVYCHDCNKGQSCGRNLALSYASGEYVYMLDSDDMILPEALEELYLKCSEDNLDVVGFETHQFREDNLFNKNGATKMITYEECPIMNGREAFIYCIETESLSHSTPTFMMKRSYLESINLRFVEGILHEDVGYVFELITRARRVRFLHKIYFLRRVRANSTMTTSFTAKNIEGFLKSFLRSFELEEMLYDLYGDDMAFKAAFRKWQRDIFGRLRQLYRMSEDAIYFQKGGNVDEEVRRLFEIVKLTTAGRSQAEDIIGAEAYVFLKSLEACKEKEIPQVYICGMGQYSERMIEMIGTMEIIIKGIITIKKNQRTFHGFPLYEPSEVQDCSLPVIMGVSHYQEQEYRIALETAGFSRILRVGF